MLNLASARVEASNAARAQATQAIIGGFGSLAGSAAKGAFDGISFGGK